MTFAYWLCVALWGTALLVALWQIGRLREWHHGYYGLALCCLPSWPVRVVALVLLLDDLSQHSVQCWEVEHAERARPDFSPIHIAFVRLVTWLRTRGVL